MLPRASDELALGIAFIIPIMARHLCSICGRSLVPLVALVMLAALLRGYESGQAALDHDEIFSWRLPSIGILVPGMGTHCDEGIVRALGRSWRRDDLGAQLGGAEAKQLEGAIALRCQERRTVLCIPVRCVSRSPCVAVLLLRWRRRQPLAAYSKPTVVSD